MIEKEKLKKLHKDLEKIVQNWQTILHERTGFTKGYISMVIRGANNKFNSIIIEEAIKLRDEEIKRLNKLNRKI